MKGTDPFWGHDFLFMDRFYRNLHSICKIENKSHFIPKIFLIFDLVFEKITIFMFLRGIFFKNFKRIEVKNHH